MRNEREQFPHGKLSDARQFHGAQNGAKQRSAEKPQR